MNKIKSIVRYDNDFNLATIDGFTATDWNLLIGLTTQFCETGGEVLTFQFSELMRLTNYKQRNNRDFKKDLISMNMKLLHAKGKLVVKNNIVMFNLFSTFSINPDEHTLRVRINPDFQYLFNSLTIRFTAFELKEFLMLRSKYSKSLYRLLKQFRTTGSYHVLIDDFKALLNIPDGYSVRDINSRIVKPSVEELKKYFRNLQFQAIKSAQRGSPVVAYDFTFQPEGAAIGKEGPEAGDSGGRQAGIGERNGFHDFPQRKYDYRDIERQLLNADS